MDVEIEQMTNAQLFGRESARSVATLTKELRRLADRLDESAAVLERGDGKAGSRAADIVSDFTQGVGNLGGRLWAIVHNAADADRAFHAAKED